MGVQVKHLPEQLRPKIAANQLRLKVAVASQFKGIGVRTSTLLRRIVRKCCVRNLTIGAAPWAPVSSETVAPCRKNAHEA